MPKNKMNWLILEIAFYLLIVFLVLDFINSIIERSKENYASIIDQITLIAEVEPNIIYQLDQEARQQRSQKLREQQQQLREQQEQRNERQQQEWNEQQEQWKDKQREQQQESRNIRRQGQEIIQRRQERIRQRQELIWLRKKY